MWVADGNTNSLINLDNIVDIQVSVFNSKETIAVISFTPVGSGETIDIGLKGKTVKEAKKIMNEIIFHLNTTTTNVYWIE